MISRRLRVFALFVGTLLWLAASAALARALEIRGIALTVANLDRAVTFYEGALGFRKVAERVIVDPEHDTLTGVFGTRVRSATLRLGDETIELEQFLSPAGQPLPPDSRSHDLWFQHFAIVVADMDKAYAHLSRVSFQAISSAPQTIPASNSAAAGIRAFKFKDPDGHPLELLWFPPDKGRAKWQRRDGALFLGIDHTAITVADTERSFAFYRDLLGFAVAGASLNSGSTQEQLDNAFGAVVRVTGLRPERAEGPGLEFLHYLTPGGGRAIPPGARPSDVVHARTVVEVDDIERVSTELTGRGVGFISPRVAAPRGASYGRAVMVRDPDGHAVLLVQP
jgi:catechol 2,3-dioxygenase-like lactoylglutathione lyase family enzyme